MPVRELIRPMMRTIRWAGLACAALPAIYVVWNFEHQPQGNVDSVAIGLRMAGVFLALGISFVLDDPTEDTTGYTPITVLMRRALRIALTFPPAFALWMLLQTWASRAAFLDAKLSAWPLALEMTAFAAAAFAGAALGSRFIADRLGGPVGAGAVVLVAIATALFPWRNGLLLRAPGSLEHAAAEPWWAALIVAAAILWWRASAVPETPLRSGLARMLRPRANSARIAWFTRRPPG